MTEHIHRTVECNVSGEQIDNYRNMLVVETVGPSTPFLYGEENYDRTLHISSEHHPFGSSRVEHEFRAFISESERVVLIKEDEGYRQLSYHDRETNDEEIQELFEILQAIVDGWDV